MGVPPAAVLTPGTFFASRYEIRRWLGSGSFGEVYEVLDRNQNAVVALKLLNRVSGAPWAEAQVLTRLHGDYILPVWNADQFAGVSYLVTELAVHGTLDQYVGPQGAPESAVRWIRAACRGATRTHDENLLHRDIKPENLFLNARGDVVLGDFGIAHLMDAAGRAPWGGTVETMAPEVFVHGPTSRASDVYSLGASMYALLTGRYPNQVSPPALRDDAPHVSQALAQRVSIAIADNPADRYQSPAEFDAALGQLPRTSRNWARTDEHAGSGHAACWRGEGAGKAAATVCLVPSGRRYEVLAQYQPTGRRIRAACRPPAPPSAVARNVRVAIAAVP